MSHGFCFTVHGKIKISKGTSKLFDGYIPIIYKKQHLVWCWTSNKQKPKWLLSNHDATHMFIFPCFSCAGKISPHLTQLSIIINVPDEKRTKFKHDLLMNSPKIHVASPVACFIRCRISCSERGPRSFPDSAGTWRPLQQRAAKPGGLLVKQNQRKTTGKWCVNGILWDFMLFYGITLW